MKLLIGCAGENDSNTISADLPRAGVPPKAQVVVLSVADLLPLPLPSEGAPPLSPAGRRARERAERALADAQRAAAAAAERLRAIFPDWETGAEAVADAPAWAILRKADEWSPDLIVVSSGDGPLVRRILLGSVAHTVLWQANASVRIAREPRTGGDGPVRVLVGIDGSPFASAAVSAVAARGWRPGTHVRLVTALDWTLSAMLRYAAHDEDERAAVERILEDGAKKLRAAGLESSTSVLDGDPKHVLVEEADRWNADSIFVGAQGLRGIERLLLGSVSAAVATRAHCSVEVVRS